MKGMEVTPWNTNKIKGTNLHKFLRTFSFGFPTIKDKDSCCTLWWIWKGLLSLQSTRHQGSLLKIAMFLQLQAQSGALKWPLITLLHDCHRIKKQSSCISCRGLGYAPLCANNKSPGEVVILVATAVTTKRHQTSKWSFPSFCSKNPTWISNHKKASKFKMSFPSFLCQKSCLDFCPATLDAFQTMETQISISTSVSGKPLTCDQSFKSTYR